MTTPNTLVHLPPRRLAALLALAGCAFVAGWVSANLPFATSVNTGLVKAFNAVGEDLFGSAVFSARAFPTDPLFPTDPMYVQLELATDAQFPAAVNLFLPPSPISPVDPCRVAAQLRVNGDGTAVVALDQSVSQVVFDTGADLSGVGLGNARCAVAPPCDPNEEICN
jgi:hypothetical protein